jgi:cobalt/nickel transport system permease protein
MHIPDGILSPVVLTTAGVASGFILAKSVKEVKKTFDQRAVPVLGVMAAFIFAAQMVNFPLLGAVASGHLIGGALAAILFSFFPASIIMTTVVTIQAIIFQDGGITALGVNILNMAIIAPAAASLLFKGMEALKVNRTVSAFIASLESG